MALEPHYSIVYSIDQDDKILSIEGGWDSFARTNGNNKFADTLIGKEIWNYIATEKVQKLYKMIFDSVRRTKQNVDIQFRCDSDKVLRFMQMSITSIERDLSIKTELLREIPRRKMLEREILYMGVHNGRPMCSHCNKIYIPSLSNWMEIDDALEAKYINGKLSVDFTICDSCTESLRTISKELN